MRSVPIEQIPELLARLLTIGNPAGFSTDAAQADVCSGGGTAVCLNGARDHAIQLGKHEESCEDGGDNHDAYRSQYDFLTRRYGSTCKCPIMPASA